MENLLHIETQVQRSRTRAFLSVYEMWAENPTATKWKWNK